MGNKIAGYTERIAEIRESKKKKRKMKDEANDDRNI